MIQTLEATIDESGHVDIREPVQLGSRHRALVTILEPCPEHDGDLAPERTQAEMAALHRARRVRFAQGEAGLVSIDLPIIDDGATW